MQSVGGTAKPCGRSMTSGRHLQQSRTQSRLHSDMGIASSAAAAAPAKSSGGGGSASCPT